jgi:hypothetical protein
MTMKIDVSVGELVDKVTILSIKVQNMSEREKAKNVRHEYDLLLESMESIGITTDSSEFRRLLEINQRLWDIEDRIRLKERDKEFDDEFIQLARSVYIENDKRAAVKRRINIEHRSDIVEEKDYAEY